MGQTQALGTSASPLLSIDLTDAGSTAQVQTPAGVWRPEGSFEFRLRTLGEVGPRAAKGKPICLLRTPMFTLTLAQTPQLVLLTIAMAHDGSLSEQEAAATAGGNVFLAFLRPELWYHCMLTWNAARGDLDFYLNGCVQEEIRLLRRRPVWPAPHAPAGPIEFNGILNPGEPDEIRLQGGPAQLWPTCFSEQQVQARIAGQPSFELTGEGRWDYAGALPVSDQDLSLLLDADFHQPLKMMHESALFDGEQRVREPADVDWVLEGPGRAQARDGVCTITSNDDSRLSHLVLWHTRCFPDNILVEFEMSAADTTRGLAILFFATRSRSGGSPFELGLEKRDGVFTRYHSGQINGYHVSYWACNVQEEGGIPRRTANLRKNRGFRMISVGVDRIGGEEPVYHRVRLLKQGGRILLETRGRVALIHHDTGRHDPIWTDGWIGLRQMGSSHQVHYRHLRVWSVGPGSR
jgi:hypothetical protein